MKKRTPITNSRLDLNALMLYHDVVNAQSITRAAQRSGRPKSTISRKLAQLEQQLGATLLKKGPRRLTTTDIGAVLFEHCQRLAAEIEDAGLSADEMQQGLRGTLRVSMPVDFGVAWLSKAIGEFAVEYPEINLEIDVNSHHVDLVEESYDVAILLGPLRSSRMVYRPLATIPRGVYGSPAYLLRRGHPASIEEFRQHDCIVTEQQRGEGMWTLRSGSGQRHVDVTGRVTVNNIAVARDLAVAGVGLAILPYALCRNDIHAGRLVHVLTDWECPPVRASALMLGRKRMPHKTRVFLDFISAHLAGNSRRLDQPSHPGIAVNRPDSASESETGSG